MNRLPDLRAAVADGADSFLFLDVDGVLNMLEYPSRFLDNDDAYRITKQRSVTLGNYEGMAHFSSDMVDDLNSILAHDNVQLVWVTFWGIHMDSAASEVFGINAARSPLAYPFVPKMSDYSGDHSKRMNVESMVRELDSVDGLRFAWVDDTAVAAYNRIMDNRDANPEFYEDDDVLSPFASADDGDVLLVDTDPGIGISRWQMKAIGDHLLRR